MSKFSIKRHRGYTERFSHEALDAKLQDKFDPESLQCETLNKISEYIEEDNFKLKVESDDPYWDVKLIDEVKNWVLDAHLYGKIKIKDPVPLSI